MRTKKFLAVPILLSSLLLCACDPNVDSVVNETNLEFQGSLDATYLGTKNVSYRVAKNGTTQIELDVFPNYVKNGGLIFTSKDTSVATVSETGLITGKKTGFTVITVKNGTNGVEIPLNIYVTESIDETQLETIITNIEEDYADASYEKPTKIREVEASSESYYKNGVLDHSMFSYEDICYDSVDGYFMIQGTDLVTKTPGGSPETSSVKWLFYVVNENLSRMFHVTNTRKTYCEVNTAPYSSAQYKKDIIDDMLDMFFVSGKGIVESLIDNASGKEDIAAIKHDVANANTFETFGGDSFFFEETYNQSSTTDNLYEIVWNGEIPAGTTTQDAGKIGFYYDGAFCRGYEAEVIQSYKIGNDNMQRVFRRKMQFSLEFEQEKISKPDENGWKHVDTIFDL